MNSDLSSRQLGAKYFYPVIVWAVLIFISSSIDGPSLPPLDVWSLDKFLHTGVYGVLSVFSLRAFAHSGEVRNKNVMWVIGWSVVFCLMYGASDEIHQSFVRGRYASLMDFIADSIGIVGIHLYYRFRSI